MKNVSDSVTKSPWKGWMLFIVSMAVVFILGMLATSVNERRAETTMIQTPKVELTSWEPRNQEWGKNYPREYQSFLQMGKDTNFVSETGGNAMIDMLEVNPRLVVLWAGYGFAKDYNQGRGHIFAIEDIKNTLRTGGPTDSETGPMPATCWTCKSPDVPRLMNELSEGGIKSGVAEFYKGKWAGKGDQIYNAIGCADCHDPSTMNLRISRPALVEAFDRMGEDVTKATHQEMRSLVCAQCHVEYYFDKKGTGEKEGVPYLTFPWDKGMSVEAMEAYYDEIGFSDWTHKLSRAPMIKAQHPGYETFKQGIHAQRGVSCADCHMPYRSEGGVKYTDHQIQSPLNNVHNSCQVCHRESEDELKGNVYERQAKVGESRDRLEELLVSAHVEAKRAWDEGATEEEMEDILMLIRHAQWRWDYSAGSHGASFHAPIEIARVVATGLDRAQEARIALAKLLQKKGVDNVPYPDITTKAKAQEFIGLPMEKLNSEKKDFLNGLAKEWEDANKKREASY